MNLSWRDEVNAIAPLGDDERALLMDVDEEQFVSEALRAVGYYPTAEQVRAADRLAFRRAVDRMARDRVIDLIAFDNARAKARAQFLDVLTGLAPLPCQCLAHRLVRLWRGR
jgi:hypothetical protein